MNIVPQSELKNNRIEDFSPYLDEITAFIEQNLQNVKWHGDEAQASCPFHEDKNPSFSINRRKGTWNCFAGCGSGGLKALAGRLGVPVPEFLEKHKEQMRDEIIAVYDYQDADGKLLYQVCRTSGKKFFQRRPDGNGGWIWNLKGVQRVLYHLPKVIEAVKNDETVFVVEGEKDVHSLEKIGLVATTNAGGAGKWWPEFSDCLKGANVIILPDNDEPGRKHAQQVAQSLQGKAASVKVLELPGLLPKGDISDWLAAGGTKEELLRLVQEAPVWGLDEWPEPEPIAVSLLPVEKLPPQIIPKPFRPWVMDVAHRMQCPVDFIAIAAMIMTGSIIGAGCGIRPKKRDDWLVVPNLWGGPVARPGMLKTPALMEALKPLAILEARAQIEYETKLKEHRAEKELHKAMKEALKSKMLEAAKGKRAKGDQQQLTLEELKRQYMELEEPEPPIWRRYKTNDSTIERMGELLAENSRGILLFRDELIGLLASWDKEGRETDRAFYLEAWNGHGSHTTDRIGRGTIHCDNLCVSILGGIQPAKLMAYLYQSMSELENDGLMQRMQLLIYPDEPGDWELVDRYPDRKARDTAFQVIERLEKMDFIAYGAQLDEGEKIPYLRFTDEAQQVFNEWLTELEKVKLKKDDPPALLEHLSKYRSLMPSLALIIHLVDVAAGKAESDVSVKAAEMAAAWCEYLESHARRIYALVGDVAQRAAAELAKKIQAGALGDGFTVRDVYRRCWHLLDKKEIVQQACDELVDAGWLRGEITEAGKTRVLYRINPKIFAPNA